MITKIQYTDSTDRQSKIDTNKDKILIEEQNITEGNFLIFTDTPRLEDQVKDLKNTVDLLLLKQEGLI